MNVVNATMEDIRGWLELAAEVESLFGSMVDEWLSVSAIERNKGVATALLNNILESIETPAEIFVTTFGEDHPEGQPARRFYQKFGFFPMQDGVPNGLEGGSRQNFKLTIAHKDSL
jgi:GNAT superfamily N-acetyltransferase